jgi:hypothetical protein
MLHLEYSLYSAETWKLRAVDQKHLESFKYGAGEGWRRSVGPVIREMKKYCLESRSRGISYIKSVHGRLIVLVIFCVETAFYCRILKER